MRITRDNYEIFFLDYLEGNLEENQIDQFLDFLEQNPDLKEELQLFEQVIIPEEKVVFEAKQNLYKAETDDLQAHDYRMIAFMEGDLDEDDRKSFENYLSIHPELQKEYDVLAKTRLAPDQNIHFPNKKKLYRKPSYAIALNWAARAAAVLILVWGINSLLPTMTKHDQPKIVAELHGNSPKPAPSVKKTEVEKNATETRTPEKQETVRTEKTFKSQGIREQTKGKLEIKKSTEPKPIDRELASLSEITPILASLDAEPLENQLAVHHSDNVVLRINDPKNLMTLDEFLASRVRKAGTEGFLSAQRILRAGLGVASELSGDRIGYKQQNGKITSIGFESKLMAFSIPLKKK